MFTWDRKHWEIFTLKNRRKNAVVPGRGKVWRCSWRGWPRSRPCTASGRVPSTQTPTSSSCPCARCREGWLEIKESYHPVSLISSNDKRSSWLAIVWPAAAYLHNKIMGWFGRCRPCRCKINKWRRIKNLDASVILSLYGAINNSDGRWINIAGQQSGRAIVTIAVYPPIVWISYNFNGLYDPNDPFLWSSWTNTEALLTSID